MAELEDFGSALRRKAGDVYKPERQHDIPVVVRARNAVLPPTLGLDNHRLRQGRA